MGNKHKAKGTSFETLIVNYLKEQDFCNARRTALAGENDAGDIHGVVQARELPSKELAIQCKNQKSFKLSEWLNATVEQASRLTRGVPLLVVKRPGKGAAAVGESYAIMPLEDMLKLLKDAGYA
jgi:Holliday junction resolvase